MKPDQKEIDAFNARHPNLAALSRIITIAAEDGIQQQYVDEWIRKRLLFKTRSHSDLAELKLIEDGLEIISQAVTKAVQEIKGEIVLSKREDLVNFNQPKYKISAVAQILKVSDRTVLYWTENRKGSIKSYKPEGYATFVLEEDLMAKYHELYGHHLKIDDNFRKQWEYRK